MGVYVVVDSVTLRLGRILVETVLIGGLEVSL